MMKQLTRSLFVVAFLIGGVVRTEAGITYDAAADFSIASNPNGVWSYGFSTSLGGPFNLYTASSNAHYGNPNFISWNSFETGDGNPGVFKNTASTTQIGEGATLLAGQLALHPGPTGHQSIVRWTAPTTGSIFVNATFEGRGNNANNTTTDVHVIFGGGGQLSGEVTGFGPSSDVILAETLDVLAGQTVDFVVGFGTNGDFNGDTTGLAATITYSAVPEPGSLMMLGTGLVGLLGYTRHRKGR